MCKGGSKDDLSYGLRSQAIQMNFFTLAELLLSVTAIVLLGPALVFATQCLLGSLPWRHRQPPQPQNRPRLAVLIPAHDESAGIACTIHNLLPQLATGDRLVVIADNCSDDTAAVARQAALATATTAEVLVLERQDPEQRGKGYALAFGRKALTRDPPDVVVFVDADCRVTSGTVADLAAWAHETGRPIQADYLLSTPQQATGLGTIGALAILVRNRVRPRGMARLGLPCQLTGSGMAMPWPLTSFADRLGANIVEDLVLGLELSLGGHSSMACPEVRVASELPTADRDASRQRRRWEHGQMATVLSYAPKLVARGIVTMKPSLVALALDIAVPPLALLVVLLAGVSVGATAMAVGGHAGLSLYLALAGLGLVAIGVLVSWFAHARRIIPLRQLLAVPLYVLWKIPLYWGFLRKREQAWKRTRREGDEAP